MGNVTVELISAVKPFTVKTGTPAAFFSEDGGRDIQKSLIDYVANFVADAAGKRFNPHVTIGVGTETYLHQLLAQPFPSFTFSATGASVYQLDLWHGSQGTPGADRGTLTLPLPCRCVMAGPGPAIHGFPPVQEQPLGFPAS